MHGCPEYCTSSCDTVWAPKPRSSRLEWSDLRVFLAIAREGTLGAAARNLAQTQPTIGPRLPALDATGALALADASRLFAVGAERDCGAALWRRIGSASGDDGHRLRGDA